MLDWLNAHGDHPPFRTVKVLPRGGYGWVEFVEAHGCSSIEEVHRFYERQGGYLALLHVQRIASIILTSIERHGWLCGNPMRVEEPGLMTGVAGIGLGLLRLADPKRVPSVLVLQPPVE